MENNNKTNTGKMIKYSYETIEGILQEMNNTHWNQLDILGIYGFLNSLRNILSMEAQVIEEEHDKNDEVTVEDLNVE